MNGYKGKRSLDYQQGQRQTIYAFAHVESWLESYAKSTNQPAAELCTRVGTLLLAQGEGTVDSVPEMRGYSARARVPMGTVEMVEHPHGGMHGGSGKRGGEERIGIKLNKDGSPRKMIKWTPAMRRAQSKRMRKWQANLQAARRAKMEGRKAA